MSQRGDMGSRRPDRLVCPPYELRGTMERDTRERRTLRRTFSIASGALLLAACSSATQTVTPTSIASVNLSPALLEADALRFADNMSRGAIHRLCVAASEDGEAGARAAWVDSFSGKGDPALGNAVFDAVMTGC